MAVVYAAEDLRDDRHVAIKVLLPELTAAIGEERFRREVGALRRLDHPGIVAILDQGIENGRSWYAMELLQGATLRDLLQQDSAEDPPQRARRLRIVRRLCGALAYLHGEGIVHGDLKPENVLVGADDRPVIIDFGIATQFDGRLRLGLQKVTGTVEGTAAYMPPEMIDAVPVDARADLYAVGCMLFEVIAGRVPFVGSVYRVLHGHSSEVPPSLTTIVEDVPRDLAQMVERLLAKDPRDRIGYAEDVAAILRDLDEDESLEREADAPPARAYVYRPGFCGRRETLEVVAAALARAQAAGELLMVGGESGIGKTRLVLEAIALARESDWRVLLGECAHESSAALEALRGPMQAVADSCRDSSTEECDRVFGSRGPVLAPYMPGLTTLPGQDRFPKPAPLPPRETLARLYGALEDTLAAFARDGPVLLVIDDLQWADELSFAFLQHLSAARLAELRMLVLANYRVEEKTTAIDALAHSPRAETIELRRLSVDAVSEMICDMLALSRPVRAFAEDLHGRAEGSPFFVAELLRFAVGERWLERRGATWTLPEQGSNSLASRDLPRSIPELVRRRLDPLDDESTALVNAAAVMGRGSSRREVQAMLGLDDSAFDAAETELLRQAVLEHAPPGLLRFQHDKIRETAYQGLHPEERGELHRRAAAAIEAECARHGDAAHTESLRRLRAADLARHYRLSGQVEKAAMAHRLAGQHAFEMSAHAEAVRQFEGAATALDELAETPERLAWKVDVLLEIYAPRMHLHSAADEGNLRICQEALPLAERLGSAERLARLCSNLAGCWFSRARYDEAIDAARQALAHAGADAPLGQCCYSGVVIGVSCVQTGRHDELFDAVEPLIDGIDATGLHEELFGVPYPPYVSLAGARGWALCLQGRRAEGEHWLARAVDVARTTGSRYAEALAHAMHAWALEPYGDGEVCTRIGERARTVAAEAGLPGPELFGLYAVGVGHVLSNRPELGMQILDQAIATSERLGYSAFRSSAMYGLAQACLMLEASDRAVQYCQEGIAFAETTGERRLTPEFFRLLAEAALHQGADTAAAERHARHALELCIRLSEPIYAPAVRLTLARALAARDAHDAAVAEARLARTGAETHHLSHVLNAIRGFEDGYLT